MSELEHTVEPPRDPCSTGRVVNLTLTIDEDVLRRPRIRALEHDTSANALVREYLESYAAAGREAVARRDLVAVARASTASSGPEGRAWTRAELHEDRRWHDSLTPALSSTPATERTSGSGPSHWRPWNKGTSARRS